MVINAAIQLLPLSTDLHRYNVIDQIIHHIQQSGLTFQVCPFETVVEGESSAVYQLIQEIQAMALEHATEIIINLKIHAAQHAVHIQDKMAKYA
jgi:uncharacterized protein YqgV (UPF0045/DUF77 family)